MKGLEIKVEFLSRVRQSDSMRLEAEFYTKARIAFESISGAEAISFSQYGTSDELNEDGIGVPVLRLNEFDTSFIGVPEKYSPLSSEVYEELRLKAGDVLICRTNGNPKLVGKSAYVPQDCQFAFASYLYRVRINNERINAETLVSYLNCKFGRAEIELYAMRGNQANFSPAKFRLIRVPVLGKVIQQKIHELFAKADAQRKIAQARYAEANEILLRELGLEGWEPPSKTVAVRKYSDFISAGRFDAEYFQPKYDDLLKRLKNMEARCLGGKDGLTTFYKSVEPGSECYGDEGVPFVRIADFSEFGIESVGVCIPPESCAECRRPKKDTILLSKDGSVGIAYKVEEDLDVVTSGGILHLTVCDDSVLPDYLMLVLNSKIVRMQAERDAGGSIIQHWKPSEIANVVIPILPKKQQKAIVEKVQSSFAARKESKRLLELAKRSVEVAIESSETAGLKLLSDNSKEVRND